MNAFTMIKPRSFLEASALMTDKRFKLPVIKAGGVDVIDHLKEGLIEPDLVVDIRRLRPTAQTWDKITVVKDTAGKETIRIEATATLAEIASSKLLREKVPVLAQSVDWAATPQVRNQATAAGNLLQRPRCWYYRHAQFDCLKKGGPTCFAVEGENKYHAIFGGGPCHIVHPSNLAPAAVVCGGSLRIVGSKRESLSMSDLYHLPGKGVGSEHNLEPSEVVTELVLDPAPKSGFYAIKEKESFDWPVAFCAVALTLSAGGDRIESARVCAGAVAPTPWPLPSVEAALKGVAVGDEAAIAKAAAGAVEGAKAMSDNGYKLKLLPVAVSRAVLRALGRPVPGFDGEAKS